MCQVSLSLPTPGVVPLPGSHIYPKETLREKNFNKKSRDEKWVHKLWSIELKEFINSAGLKMDVVQAIKKLLWAQLNADNRHSTELRYHCAQDELLTKMPHTDCHKHKKPKHPLVQLTLERIWVLKFII